MTTYDMTTITVEFYEKELTADIRDKDTGRYKMTLTYSDRESLERAEEQARRNDPLFLF